MAEAEVEEAAVEGAEAETEGEEGSMSRGALEEGMGGVEVRLGFTDGLPDPAALDTLEGVAAAAVEFAPAVISVWFAAVGAAVPVRVGVSC